MFFKFVTIKKNFTFLYWQISNKNLRLYPFFLLTKPPSSEYPFLKKDLTPVPKRVLLRNFDFHATRTHMKMENAVMRKRIFYDMRTSKLERKNMGNYEWNLFLWKCLCQFERITFKNCYFNGTFDSFKL